MAIRPGEGISGIVAQTNRAILVEDTLADSRFLKGVDGCRSELCVPMIHNAMTIGVINVESDNPAFFSDQDSHHLETLASQIAAALETARLRERSCSSCSASGAAASEPVTARQFRCTCLRSPSTPFGVLVRAIGLSCSGVVLEVVQLGALAGVDERHPVQIVGRSWAARSPPRARPRAECGTPPPERRPAAFGSFGACLKTGSAEGREPARPRTATRARPAKMSAARAGPRSLDERGRHIESGHQRIH